MYAEELPAHHAYRHPRPLEELHVGDRIWFQGRAVLFLGCRLSGEPLTWLGPLPRILVEAQEVTAPHRPVTFYVGSYGDCLFVWG